MSKYAYLPLALLALQMTPVFAEDSPGVTDTTLSLGSFAPMSGPRAPLQAFNRQIEAYFKDVNAHGGITFGDGKTRIVDFKLVDTGGQPARALAAARELIEHDNVFALLSPFGQNENLAIADYVNAKEVPQLFVNTAGTYWGANPAKLPWSMGFPPVAGTQIGVIAAYLKKVKPSGKIALLRGNDEYGREISDALDRVLAGSDLKIIATETYEYSDTTVDSQIIKLADSGADVFLNFAIGRPSLLALQKANDIGWKPLRVVEVTAATSGLVRQLPPEVAAGVISTNYYKDPNTEEFRDDPAIKKFHDVMGKYYGAGYDPTVLPVGATEGEAFEKIAQGLKDMTRAGLMKAARSLHDVEISYLLPGIRLNTSATDSFPIDQMQIIEFKNGGFVRTGDVITAAPL
jgi:branched-chain amino acid transport system substrate-binding protein